MLLVDACCSLVAVWCWLFSARCLLCVACRLVFVAGCGVCGVVCCSLFVVCSHMLCTFVDAWWLLRVVWCVMCVVCFVDGCL